MKTIKYIGGFPPPYGGVTVKNDLIYSEISKWIAVDRNTGKNRLICQLKDILNILFFRRTLIIGVSASRGKSGFITKMLYKFNRKTMRKSIYFMMGGLEAGRIADSLNHIKMYSNYARVYVETAAMKECLVNVGLSNCLLFPNCRKRPVSEYLINTNYERRLSCVFFSNIQLIKGVDVVLEVAEKLINVDFYFYGYIDKEIEEEFIAKCNTTNNVFYKGIFDAKTHDVYEELRQYDALLFPTRWRNEGVPGVLVEGKIAGLAEIVSNMCYNAELVSDGTEGIVLKDNNTDCLAEAIDILDSDREYLHRLKEGSRNSAERFYIDNYIGEVINSLRG